MVQYSFEIVQMDALAALVTLLRPRPVLSKVVEGRGPWGVRYTAYGGPSFGLVLAGSCWFAAEGAPPFTLETGDFVLFTATPRFTMASDPAVTPREIDALSRDAQVDEVIHGDPALPPNVRLLGGYFAIDPINASMLVSQLPGMLHISSADAAMQSIALVVELVKRETLQHRPGQSLILARLADVLLVEALRSAPAGLSGLGLLAGLRDPQLTAALRAIHIRHADPWTLATLARQAGMSRSSFADRFARIIGTTPLNYLLQWRMAVAKDLLVRESLSVAETAFAVGYQSASSFSTAFTREAGSPPRQFAECHRGRAADISAV
jgi:AraC-like DNA-binding protein